MALLLRSGFAEISSKCSKVPGCIFLIYYREQCYNTLKVCVRGQRSDQEVAISENLKQSSNVHRQRLVRLVLDSFEIVGPHGKHVCLICQPLRMSFSEFQVLLPDKKFPKGLSQRSIQLTLIALAFMQKNNVIHTDISPNNILQGMEDTYILSRMEQDELIRPISRKVLADRTIYHSRAMPLCTGSPVLSDLGEARLGVGKHRGDIMPGIYRAPEVILEMDWDQKVPGAFPSRLSRIESCNPPARTNHFSSGSCAEFFDGYQRSGRLRRSWFMTLS
ncbi:uncharacterized protein BJX67DRAFT_292184 [Aspergillus lucknowensis]|uniref:Protein kinase domain-containing protein n=1 Tax=Aspergillus lucknowensis TaxID=176173 RepID=A0ABR4LDT0_9EURO